MSRRGGRSGSRGRRGGGGRVRIVAGEFGGRFIRSPPGDGTRPTMAQVREAVFSILGPVDGLRCADLFAGTGAYGLEALSRGAATVEAFEADRRVADMLGDNAASLLGDQQPERFRLHVGRLPGALLRAGHDSGEDRAAQGRHWAPYDLIFVDPPWGLGYGPKVGATLLGLTPTSGGERFVAPDARLVVEEASRTTADVGVWREAGWDVSDERRYGEATITMLRPR